MKYQHLFFTSAAFMVILTASGCASTGGGTKYQWHNYEDALYNHYKTPADATAYQKALEEVIASAEKNNAKVPPGIYADYGYLMLQMNRNADAVRYFTLERDTWPEAVPLMNKMIDIAQPATKKEEVKQ